MKNKFDTIFQQLLVLEGGYSNHPDDLGGETLWGISQRALDRIGLKREDVNTKEKAKSFYYNYYYANYNIDKLPEPAHTLVFLTGVLIGTRKAIRILQRTIGTKADGIIGSNTIAYSKSVRPDLLTAEFLIRTYKYLIRLQSFRTFGIGWVRRLFLTAYYATANKYGYKN